MRVVSLLPSATEIVYLLGLGDQLTGVSHECDYPPVALGKRKIIRPAFEGSTLSSQEIDARVRAAFARREGIYQIDLEALKAADPDLILTQELCDVCAAPYEDVLEVVTKLPRKPEVLSLDPQRLGDVLRDVERVGEATGRLREAEDAVTSLEERVAIVAEQAAKTMARPKVLCLEWLDPLMASGHWIPEMVALAGGIEPVGKLGIPSRRVGWEEVLSSAPDILVLMPCGFAVERVLKEIHLVTGLPEWKDLPAVQAGKVFAVNGHAYYSRSGPRLVDGLEILAHIIHPALFPGPTPEGAVKRVDR
ncbi:MAG: cobalamin-binding protein [Candidatus Methylomirabilales bacterium]